MVMKYLAEMNAIAGVIIDPAKDERVRKNSMAAYSIPFAQVEHPLEKIAIIDAFLMHARDFATIAEAQDATVGLRSAALTFALSENFLQLGNDAKAQTAALESLSRLTLHHSRATSSLADHMKPREKEIYMLVQRVVNIAKDDENDADIRKEAIKCFDKMITAAETCFGLKITRDEFDDDFMSIALNDTNRDITTCALLFGARERPFPG